MLLTAVIALLATSCGTRTKSSATDDHQLSGMVRTPALKVGDVSLLDVSTDSPTPAVVTPPAGHLTLVYFGYTSCPDICPMTMNDIRVALGDLTPANAAKVTVGMVTVDPDRDTPDALRKYLGHFFDRSMALQAADPAALDAAAKTFGVRYEVAEHPPGATTYDVSHSAVTYVVDDTGTVVVEWPFGFDSELMAKDLNILLEADHA